MDKIAALYMSVLFVYAAIPATLLTLLLHRIGKFDSQKSVMLGIGAFVLLFAVLWVFTPAPDL